SIPQNVRRQYLFTIPPTPRSRGRSPRPGSTGNLSWSTVHVLIGRRHRQDSRGSHRRRQRGPLRGIAKAHDLVDVPVQAVTSPGPVLHFIHLALARRGVVIAVGAAILETDEDVARAQLVGPYTALAAEVRVGRHRLTPDS